MNWNLIIILLIIYIFFYLSRNSEYFRNYNYDMIVERPYSYEPDVDYQAYLNTVSGYNSGTRGYSNPYYAQQVASGLDT